jgi:hypothetical protein
MINEPLNQLLNSVQNVKECDATNDDSNKTARLIKTILNFTSCNKYLMQCVAVRSSQGFSITGSTRTS